MYGVVLLLVVAMLSLLITRVATIALTATGMPRPAARWFVELTERQAGADGDRAHAMAAAEPAEARTG